MTSLPRLSFPPVSFFRPSLHRRAFFSQRVSAAVLLLCACFLLAVASPAQTATAPIESGPQAVGAPDFALTATPNPAHIGVGLTIAITITLKPLNGFADTVSVTCPKSLPTESTCNLSQPILSETSPTSTLYITTTSPHDCGSTTPYFYGTTTTSRAIPPPSPAKAPGACVAAALAGLIITLIPRRRALKPLLSIALCILVGGLMGGLLLSTTGCGHCTDLGTKPGTYTIPITGASSSTSITHTAAVKLVVQV